MNSHRPGNQTNVSGRRVHGDTHMLSIIIPTLNEEKYLPILLESIKKQTLPEHEIIVSDGSSDDATVAIAQKSGCRVVISTKRSPAAQRNAGASAARGDVILFLDADSTLGEHAISKSLKEFSSKHLDVASYYFRFDSDELKYRVLRAYGTMFVFLFHRIHPYAVGAAILVRKNWFTKVNGFNEQVAIGEDHLFAKNIKDAGGKFGILSDPIIFFSTRRARKEGLWTLLFKIHYCMMYYAFHGPFSRKIVPYEFGKYNESI